LIFQALDILVMFFVLTLVHGPFRFKEISGLPNGRRSRAPTSERLSPARHSQSPAFRRTEPSPARHCDGGRRSSRSCPARQKRDSDESANLGSQVLKIEILRSLRTKRAPGAFPNPGPQKVHLDPGSQVLKVEVLKVPIVAEGHGHPLVTPSFTFTLPSQQLPI